MVDIALLSARVDTRDFAAFNRTLDDTRRKSGEAERSVDRMGGGVSRLGGSLVSVRAILGGVAAGFAAVGVSLGVPAVVAAADAWTNLRSQLRLVTDDSEELARAQQDVFATAQATRQTVEGTAQLYTRYARSVRELREDQSRLADVVETTNQAVALASTTAAAANAALFQLGQGLAADALRGQELNSVMEQTPRLAEAIADGLGVPIGRLRELAEAGELTAARVIQAIESQRDVIEREFAQVEVTVGQAATTLGNSFGLVIDRMNRGSDATANLAGAIQSMARSLETTDFSVFTNFLATTVRELQAIAGLWEQTQDFFGLSGRSQIQAEVAAGQGLIRALPPIRSTVPPNVLRAEGGEVVPSSISPATLRPAPIPELKPDFQNILRERERLQTAADAKAAQEVADRLRVEEEINRLIFERDQLIRPNEVEARLRQLSPEARDDPRARTTIEQITLLEAERTAQENAREIALARSSELQAQMAADARDWQQTVGLAVNTMVQGLGQALVTSQSMSDVLRAIGTRLFDIGLSAFAQQATNYLLSQQGGQQSTGTGLNTALAIGSALLSSGIAGGQHGLDFTVPGGGTADDRLAVLKVTAGEQVAIRPSGRRMEGGSSISVGDVHIHAGANADAASLAQLRIEVRQQMDAMPARLLAEVESRPGYANRLGVER